MKRKHWLIVVGALSLLYFVLLLYYAQVRGIEPDEGFYPLAARLAWEGKIPYRDFMFSQGVLVPYVYGWIWAVHPQSLVSMRFLSVTLGAVSVFLWGYFLFSVKRWSTGVALSGFLIILLNPYWIALHTIVKTFAVADLLMSAVMICLYLGIHSGRARWYLVAGVALGLCASARALYGPLVLFVLAWLALVDWRESGHGFRRSLAYLAGAVCGFLPMLFSFAADPAAFIFNNFQYRRILDSYLTSSFSQTFHRHLADVFHFMQPRRFFQAALLLAMLGIISFLELRKKKNGPYTRQDHQFFQLAFLMMVVYSATALIPLPTWAQYYDGPLLPFLIFFILEGLRVAFQVSWKWAVVFAILAPVLCWRDVRFEVNEFSFRRRLHLRSYQQVAEIVRANSGPDATVLSIWPGYVFESGRRCFPGAENEFVYPVAEKVSPELRKRYHLVSKEEVLSALSAGVPDIYIPAPHIYLYLSDAENRTFQNAVNAKYSLVKTVDDILIYRNNR